MSEPKWSIGDEFMRMAESYIQNTKPTSISDLFDLFEKAAKPKTPGGGTGFDEFVDDPRVATPLPQKEESKSSIDMPIELFTCPSCKTVVFGVAEYEVKDTTPTNDGCFTADMRMTGVRVRAHDCTPKVTR